MSPDQISWTRVETELTEEALRAEPVGAMYFCRGNHWGQPQLNFKYAVKVGANQWAIGVSNSSAKAWEEMQARSRLKDDIAFDFDFDLEPQNEDWPAGTQLAPEVVRDATTKVTLVGTVPADAPRGEQTPWRTCWTSCSPHARRSH